MTNYDCGLIIGRFQPFHLGHCIILERALAQCNKVIIVIGSAQESRTPLNPLTVKEREQIIIDSFVNRLGTDTLEKIEFLPLNDRENWSNDSSFGEYVMEAIRKHFDIVPNVVFEGKESCRNSWFDTIGIDIVQISRTKCTTSGTQLREAIYNGYRSVWENECAPGTEDWFDNIREAILDATKDRGIN